MTNPYSPTSRPQSDVPVRPASAYEAVGRACRDGFVLSLFTMGPLAFLVTQVVGRRLKQDSAGNVLPQFEPVNWMGASQEILLTAIPVVVLWTTCAGVVGLIRYTIRNEKE